MMNKQYMKKQIVEAINQWKSSLGLATIEESMNQPISLKSLIGLTSGELYARLKTRRFFSFNKWQIDTMKSKESADDYER